jgi:ubiquinone biosynthesis protein COQ4
MAMTETQSTYSEELRRGRQWGTALKALRRLLSDRDDTGQVFEIMRALNGGNSAINYRRLLETPTGGQLACDHVELAPMLMDQTWLDSFPAGSVGAAYRDFVRSENLSAEGLAEISRRSRAEEIHPYAWFGRRMRDSHDIWHVLSGYHRDGLGEACLVAFSYAQTRGLGWAVIALGAGLSAVKERSLPHARAIWQGYQRGRAAKWLPAEDYVQLMREPLDAARKRLNITPASAYDAIPFAERTRRPSGNSPIGASQAA